MNPDSLRELRIFVASPADMTAERAKVETVVTTLKPLADYIGVTLKIWDWRRAVPDIGRPQQIIFDELKPTSWDVFIGILWHRFGTPLGKRDPQTHEEYLSGTEEEFKTAFRLWERFGRPRVLLFRCTRQVALDILDPDQFKRVKEFLAQFAAVKGAHPALYQSFDTTESFEKLLLDNLQKLLLEYSEQSKMLITPEVAQILVPKIPNNLPRRAAFFGRAKEMEVVMRALSPADRAWGVLVDGIGGIGKTALAVEAAYRAQDAGAFEAFVFITAKQNILVPSGIREQTPAARTLDDFLNDTARVLGQPGIAKLTSDEKRRALLDVLRAMRTLLIYDNLETLSKEEQEAMADFLRELPQGCKAIITSRRRGGESAMWLRVEKLDWEAARGIIENEMGRDVGLANKLRRAESRWQELYDETNGSPLALVHTLGLMRVRAALTFDGALTMLRGNRDADLQKFIFQEARKELTTNDKTALGALSFFVPSATFEAWLQVANLSRNALETMIDRLSAHSLVDVLPGKERYALHPLTRAFVRDELLADANVARETGMRFARYWVEYAKRYGGDYNYSTYDQLRMEWTNLNAAANWLWETLRAQADLMDHADAALMLNDLAGALNQFLLSDGRWDERVLLNTWAYGAMQTLQDWVEAGWKAYRVWWVQYCRDDTDESIRWSSLCIEAWVHGGSEKEKAMSFRMRGLMAEKSGDYNTAERFCQDALAIWRDLGLDTSVSIALRDLSAIEIARKRYDTAERYFREALELNEKVDSKSGMAIGYGDLGYLALKRKRWAEAREWFQKELPLAEEVGSRDLMAHAKSGLARAWEAEERADLALPLAQDALRILERLQHKDLAEVRELVERLKPPP